MQDQRLLFRLLKQKFVECVRRGTYDDDQQAVGAYPDCYFHNLNPCLALTLLDSVPALP